MENEVWKDIEGYEGIYQVSNLGRVRSLDHMSFRNLKGALYDCLVRGRVLCLSKDSSGYLQVRLWNENGGKSYLVHRLVAKTFLPNPDNFETVNHKDENILNNRVDNLEYMSVTDNIRYGTGIVRRSKTLRKPVEQLTKDGVHVAYYDGIIDASIATGASRELIGKVCHGRKKSAGGFRWRFKE